MSAAVDKSTSLAGTDDGAVAAALGVLARSDSTADDVVAACKALAAAAMVDARVAGACVSRNCIVPVVASLAKHAVAEASCVALWRLAWASDDAAAAIAAAGAVEPVVATLQRHIAFAPVVQAACGVLGRVAFVDPKCAAAISLCGGNLAILAALKAHVSNESVIDAACGAVQRSAISTELTVNACAELAAQMLTAARAHPASDRVLDAVCAALVALAWASKYQGFEAAMKAKGCDGAVVRAVSPQAPPFPRERTLQDMRQETRRALQAMVDDRSGSKAGAACTSSSDTTTSCCFDASEAADPYDAVYAACNALRLADLNRALAACTKPLYADKRVALVAALVHVQEFDKDSDHDDDDDDGEDDDKRPRAYRRVQALRMLVERGLLDSPAIARRALLSAMAVTDCSSSFLRVLVEDAGADLHDEPTCLHNNMDPETLRLLLDAGADVNSRDVDGATPLMKFLMYCEDGCGEDQIPVVVQLLLRHGADASLVDDIGYTALNYILDFADDFSIPEATIRLVARAAAWHRRRHLLLLVRGRYPATLDAADDEDLAFASDDDDEPMRREAIAYKKSYLGYW